MTYLLHSMSQFQLPSSLTPSNVQIFCKFYAKAMSNLKLALAFMKSRESDFKKINYVEAHCYQSIKLTRAYQLFIPKMKVESYLENTDIWDFVLTRKLDELNAFKSNAANCVSEAEIMSKSI